MISLFKHNIFFISISISVNSPFARFVVYMSLYFIFAFPESWNLLMFDVPNKIIRISCVITQFVNVETCRYSICGTKNLYLSFKSLTTMPFIYLFLKLIEIQFALYSQDVFNNLDLFFRCVIFQMLKLNDQEFLGQASCVLSEVSFHAYIFWKWSNRIWCSGIQEGRRRYY